MSPPPPPTLLLPLLLLPLLLLLSVVADADTDGCPNESWMPFGGRCYLPLLVPPFQTMSWSDAAKACRTIQPGSHLPSIHNDAENGAIEIMQGQTTSWLGLTNFTGNGWAWMDGTEVDYVNWGEDQPDDAYGAEYCTYITLDGTWGDFVCEEYGSLAICVVPAA
ncbi:C-type Lectin CRL-like [Pollicipes pollicipes]|uniref:C-type Lectin CRL-like n=1 Tax=Pollicipes pollicipes TaxID=41117 RepID=UPI00188512B2|nr:C-type Lectin CRL-like [Pollicipes pollicipes]